VSFAELAFDRLDLELSEKPGIRTCFPECRSNSLLMAVAGQSFQPIGTPVTFTGFSQETLNAFAPQLLQAGLYPLVVRRRCCSDLADEKSGRDYACRWRTRYRCI
jgi:hypothetical protein